MKKALDGIKVIDLSHVLAAPFCTMILADMGADIVKVEPPVHGDDSRAFGPFYDAKEGGEKHLLRSIGERQLPNKWQHK